ncbi:MAG: hypothetical protein WAV20_10005 [Blastocatellia bacterium]
MPKERTPVRISLSKKDWAATLKSATSVKTLPKGGVRFLLIPNPDGGADGYPFCHEQGPETNCQIKSTPQADGSLAFECRCRPAGGGGGGSSPTLPGTIKPCLLITSGRLRCLKLDCDGACELVFVEKNFLGRTLYMATCRCSKG